MKKFILVFLMITTAQGGFAQTTPSPLEPSQDEVWKDHFELSWECTIDCKYVEVKSDGSLIYTYETTNPANRIFSFTAHKRTADGWSKTLYNMDLTKLQPDHRDNGRTYRFDGIVQFSDDGKKIGMRMRLDGYVGNSFLYAVTDISLNMDARIQYIPVIAYSTNPVGGKADNEYHFLNDYSFYLNSVYISHGYGNVTNIAYVKEIGGSGKEYASHDVDVTIGLFENSNIYYFWPTQKMDSLTGEPNYLTIGELKKRDKVVTIPNAEIWVPKNRQVQLRKEKKDVLFLNNEGKLVRVRLLNGTKTVSELKSIQRPEIKSYYFLDEKRIRLELTNRRGDQIVDLENDQILLNTRHEMNSLSRDLRYGSYRDGDQRKKLLVDTQNNTNVFEFAEGDEVQFLNGYDDLMVESGTRFHRRFFRRK